MILPKDRGPRLITLRRAGTLTEADHRLLALWAAVCAGAKLTTLVTLVMFDQV